MSKHAADKLFFAHDEMMERLEAISKDTPWENPEFYAQWCGQFYYFVCHATRMLAAAAARFPVDRDVLHWRFLDHCQEEKHHENLFLDDLKNMGRSIKEFPESPLTAQMYQSQYYLIEHRDPIALFGGVFYMEGMSLGPGPEIYKRARAAHGEQACNFIRVHVSEDQDHLQKAKTALRALPEEHLQLVEWSMSQTGVVYEALLRELSYVARNKSKHVA